MADIDWPATLPQRLEQANYSQAGGQGAIRQDMDSGPAFQRPRYSAVATPISGSLLLDVAQVATFRDPGTGIRGQYT